MKMKLKRALSLVLTVTMLLSLVSLSAFAAGETGTASAAEETAEPVGIAGMLSLDKYVVESTETSVEFVCYGTFVAGSESDPASYVLGTENPDELTVYSDQTLQTVMKGVTAQIKDGKLIVSGLSGTDNTVCYISPGKSARTTIVYVVADQADTSFVQKLRDGTSLNLTGYAPVNGTSDFYFGGNQTLSSASDYADLEKATEAEKAVADWWLHSGVTNGGVSTEKFGSKFYVSELSVYLYRNFQLMVDEAMGAADYYEPSDYNGGMPANDQFGDSVPVTLYAGCWDGIFTTWGEDGKLHNIEGVTKMGYQNPVSEEYLMVSLYNTLNSVRACLTEKGEKIRDQINAAAGENPDNAAKIKAVETVLGVNYEELVANSTSQKLAVLTVLSKLDDCTTYITSMEGTTLTGEDGKALYVPYTMADLMAIQAENHVISSDKDITSSDELTAPDRSTAAYITGGTVNITNSLITAKGDATKTNELIGFGGPTFVTNIPVFSTQGYNTTVSNAYYRYGVNALLPVHGYNTHVNLTSTNGQLLLSGPADGEDSGGLYNGFGATVKINNGILYSDGQHPSNTCYNGTIHYKDSAVIGSVRQYSSDFWGGYIVMEDNMSIGRGFADEPTTIIYKNSYTDMDSLGKDGSASWINMTSMSSMYLENSAVDHGHISFTNNTSLLTDTTSLTMVNTSWNGRDIASMTRSAKAVITLVDSDINLTTDSILTLNQNITQNMGEDVLKNDPELAEYYNVHADVKIMGDVYLSTPNTAGFAINDETASVTLYVNHIYGKLDTSNVKVVTGEEYGDLYVNAAPFVDDDGTGDWIWASDYIYACANAGIIKGFPDDTYQPAEQLTRAQTAELIASAMNLTDAAADVHFKDDDGTGDWAWASSAIYACAKAGIIKGYPDGTFKPDAPITRAELVTMVIAAVKPSAGSKTTELSDIAGHWAEKDIGLSASNGIVNGYPDGTFKPDAPITRAEAAKVIANAFKLI